MLQRAVAKLTALEAWVMEQEPPARRMLFADVGNWMMI